MTFELESTSPARMRFRRVVVGALGTAVAALMVLPAGTASAHVTVQPGEAAGGDFTVVSFRVPTERDDASTTKVQVHLPKDHPLGSVRTTPVPGWRVTTKTRTLDEPIDLFGEKLDTVVSQITWTTTGKGIPPAQFEDFDVSLGPLPESGEMVFPTIQTYSSGEVVKWNEVAVDGTSEPEHPAPVLTISAPVSESEEASDGDGDSDVLPIVLSGTAAVVSLAALGLAWRRRA